MTTPSEHARVLIAVQNATTHAKLPSESELTAWCRAALPAEAAGELTLRLVDASEGAELNARYRGREGATNVLSFPSDPDLPELENEPRPLGDIVICAPLVATEAAAQGKPERAHWAHLVVHGTLHLLGYDHDTDAVAEVMEAEEQRILAGLGFPDPYAEPDLQSRGG